MLGKYTNEQPSYQASALCGAIDKENKSRKQKILFNRAPVCIELGTLQAIQQQRALRFLEHDKFFIGDYL